MFFARDLQQNYVTKQKGLGVGEWDNMEYGAQCGKTQTYRDSGKSHTSASRINPRQIIEHDCSEVNTRECLFFLGGGCRWGGMTPPSRSAPSHFLCVTITLRHTTILWTPLDEWSVRCRDFHMRNTHKRQTSMSPEGFQPATPANERTETHAFNRAATGIGSLNKYTNVIVIHTLLRAVAQSGKFPKLAQTFPFPFLPLPTFLPTM